MMKKRSLLFLPVVLLSACASQSDMSYVQGQVSQLKQESQVIKQQSAGSYSEITQYREEIATLQGKIDELHHDYRVSMKRLDMEDSLQVSKSNELESRIARLEQYLGLDISSAGKSQATVVLPPPKPVPGTSQASSTPAAAPSNAPGQVKSSASPDSPSSSQVQKASAATASSPDGADQLQEGLIRMKKEDYAGARENFKAFMAGNPKSPKVADAQFYVAETYFSEKWYEKAILEYQVVIARYTKNPKRPAALYKQGLSFEKIGDKANASARYKDVISLYPSSPEAKLAKKNLGRK
jgi:tol-pal system protein YbgF